VLALALYDQAALGVPDISEGLTQEASVQDAN
jgi:hypothetical protein